MKNQFTITKKGSVPTSLVTPVLIVMAIVTTMSLTLALGTVQDNQASAIAGLIDTTKVGASAQGYWTTAPAGYLIEDGSAVSRTTYANLFAVIGTTFGAGDGSTTFNLPDSRGRVSVAKNPGDIEFNLLGETGGEKAHTLTTAEVAYHTHTMNHDHGAATTSSAGSHAHSVYIGWNTFDSTGASKYTATNVGGVQVTGSPPVAAYGATESGGSHTHSVNLPTYYGSSGAAGNASPTPHNNLQPYIVALTVIKY